MKQLRQLAIDLLDNENGVPEKGYYSLRAYVASIPGAEEALADIWACLDGSDGVYYLPEDHGLEA